MSKQLIEIDGEPLLRAVVRAALATAPMQVLIVVGARADAVFATVADLGVERVDCPAWAEGMAASLRAGIAALGADGAGALIVLCDQPALTAAHLQTLVETWRRQPQRAVASAYAGTLGVPALLPRRWFAGLMRLSGDQGAREWLRRRSAEVTAVTAPDLAQDIDHPDDLPAQHIITKT